MKKKIALILLLVLTTFVVIPASAGIDFGLKGGLNVTDLSFDNKVLNSSNRAGFFIGPTAKFTVPIVGLGVDISALYDQKSSKVDDNGEINNVTTKQIVVPINARYTVGLSSLASIYFAGGPQFGFNVGDSKFALVNNETYQLKKSELSINLGAGVTLIRHLEVGVGYNIGLGNTGTVNVISAAENAIKDKSKSNTWKISVAYYF